MKKYINRKSILITSVALLLAVAVGVSLAYIFTETEPVENKFNPSKVSCAVVEEGVAPVTGSIVGNVETKENVKIQNTGDTDAYIRVALVANWINEAGKVWAKAPVLGTDYTMTLDLENGWIDGGDGFYYYTESVDPGEMTGILIKNASQKVVGPTGTDSTQYYLSIEIVASAIQADGMGATSAQDAWVQALKTATNG